MNEHENFIPHIAFFKTVVGQEHVVTDAIELKSLGTDWTKVYEPNPSVAVFPKNTEETSKIVRYCYEKNIAIVPSGGRTGLAGGAVAKDYEVIISLNRLNRIEKIDIVGMTATCEAGVTTQALKEAADHEGLFFSLDLAAKGTSQIGGNIATNAGGLKLIRYGGTRELVLGLEVVLPDGDVLDMNTKLRKDNTGYDLKHLFIGSEGTLGIITKATLKLSNKPAQFKIACMCVENFSKIPQILRACNLSGIKPSAFEFMTQESMDLVLKYHANLRIPFQNRAPFYVFLEIDEGDHGGRDALGEILEQLFNDELIEDGVIASSSPEFHGMWALRENISESCSQFGHVHKNDISVAIEDLESFVVELQKILNSEASFLKIILFGHIGDGNVHINYLGLPDLNKASFLSEAHRLEEKVFTLLSRFDGSISAEHGIGLLKRNDLKFSRTEAEIGIMKNIKRLFDPKNIMNPGKIFEI